MKYKKQIKEQNRQRQMASFGIEEEYDNSGRRIHEPPQKKRAVRNLRKAWEEHVEDWDEVDEFFGK